MAELSGEIFIPGRPVEARCPLQALLACYFISVLVATGSSVSSRARWLTANSLRLSSIPRIAPVGRPRWNFSVSRLLLKRVQPKSSSRGRDISASKSAEKDLGRPVPSIHHFPALSQLLMGQRAH